MITIYLRLPTDVDWSTLRIVDLQDANVSFLSDIFGRLGDYLFEHGHIRWKIADQYFSALKKQILTSVSTILPIFRQNLHRMYDQRADEDEVDLIRHHKRFCDDCVNTSMVMVMYL